MSEYIVSARKYRPQTFDAVVGQRALTTTLKNAIASGRLAHAYLFCGPRGVGKTTCARIFARTINCLTPTAEGEACGACESCRAMAENRSYNVHELDAASNNSVDDMRALIEQVQVPPQVGRYKVFIIDEVHMLSTAAFNAFLKTLEEPPAHAIFILATTEKHKILPTILSRCQTYDFARMEVRDIVAHLRHVATEEGIEAEDEALNLIAQKADGGMRDALSIFDQVASFSEGKITYEKALTDLGALSVEHYFSMVDALYAGDVKQCLLLLNDVLQKGFDAGQFMGGLASHLRDLLVSRDEATLGLLDVSESVRPRYAEQAKRLTPRWLFAALRASNECDLHYRESRNKRLLVELTLIQVAQLASPADEPPSGLGPTKLHIQPLPVAAPVAATPKNIAPSASQAPAPAVQAPQPAAPSPISAVPSPQPATPSPVSAAQGSAAPASGGRISIKAALQQVQAAQAQAAAQPQAEQEAVSPTAHITDRFNFSQQQLEEAWIRYAQSLPREQAALSARIRHIRPELKEGFVVDVPVSNPQVEKDLASVCTPLTVFLADTLKNGALTLQIRIVEEEEEHRPYTPKEHYAEIMKEYPFLKDFVTHLKLRID